MDVMHLNRWLTSLVAVPILVLFLIKAPPPLFALFIGLIAIIALWEYNRIVFSGLKQAVGWLIPLWGALVGLLVLYAVYSAGWRYIPELILVNGLGAAVFSIPRFKTDNRVVEGVARQMQGLIYIPLALSTLILLRMGPNGVRWIFFLLFVVFLGDVGAFYAGRIFGRHKLCPAVSPGKTIEGAIGAMAVSIAVGFCFMLIFLPHLPPIGSLFLFIAVSFAGQAGDLFESELKRVSRVKDSGSILPGHGGLLDRVDALLFAAPTAYLFKTYVLKLF